MGSIAFQLGEKALLGTVWYLSEAPEIFLDALASKHIDILKAFKKEQEDCTQNGL